jgi:hypothetical protein
MADKMLVSCRYGTHLPCLIRAMEKTSGDVLELGMGVFSTPYLHYKCMLDNRKLVSYENFESWMNFFVKYGYRNPNHDINFIEKYSDAPIDKEWDLVLIDQTPDWSRAEEAKRLKDKAKYIVIHDSNEGRRYQQFHYDSIYPLFKYKSVWDKDSNHATVLSNFIDLTDFWK